MDQPLVLSILMMLDAAITTLECSVVLMSPVKGVVMNIEYVICMGPDRVSMHSTVWRLACGEILR
jgi:uncharacterized protein (DUF983 family)